MTNPIYIHNTLSRQREVFQPISPAHVRMYVCGPTVYDFAHLGNARPVVVFDTLFRLLQRHYPQVTYVRNITDVDDKIMARAKETGEPIDSITGRTTQAYHDDMGALNALPPTIEPRATGHIPEMITMIETLLEKGHAYVADGHVLFNVPSMAEYGQLSRRNRDELIAGARVDVAPYKKDAADFVLWKPSAADQPGWDSPWGRGRPGWHIECSAMSKKHLGEMFDIHGGGLDLIFPHHENEIAQSRCAHGGTPLATYWMHNGFLTINNDKMSKSLGNFFTVRDVLAKAPGEAVRLALLSAHYRQPLDFTLDKLDQAKQTLDRWYNALKNAELTDAPVDGAVEDALCDDLNVPLAISHLHALADKIFKLAGSEKNGAEKNKLASVLRASANTIGLLQQSPQQWFSWQPATATLAPDVIEQKIAARAAAKAAKDYALADKIRAELLADGITLEDGPKGTTWHR